MVKNCSVRFRPALTSGSDLGRAAEGLVPVVPATNEDHSSLDHVCLLAVPVDEGNLHAYHFNGLREHGRR